MRTLIAFVLIALLAACGGKSDDPVVPVACPGGFSSGPPTIASNQLVFDSDRAGGTHEIWVMKTDGSCPARLTNDATHQNWWPRVSPDRTKVLFYRAPANKPESYADASLWVMNANGTGVTQLRAQGEDGWVTQGHGEWSPDGSKIAMFGGLSLTNAEIFVTDASGKNPMQYTNRGGINTDVSWSPDGSKLLFNGCAVATTCQKANYEIFSMNATPMAAATQITFDGLADYDPYFSPDGTKIAWLVNVDPAANSNLGRWAIKIATPPGPATYLIDDGNINSKPAWSLDSKTIFFHRMVVSEGKRFRVFKINPDGTGLTEMTPGATGNSEHPSN